MNDRTGSDPAASEGTGDEEFGLGCRARRPTRCHPGGDCIPVMAAMPAESVDMSVFSPPFRIAVRGPARPATSATGGVWGQCCWIGSGWFFYRQRAGDGCLTAAWMVLRRSLGQGGRGGSVATGQGGVNIRLGERSLVYEYDAPSERTFPRPGFADRLSLHVCGAGIRLEQRDVFTTTHRSGHRETGCSDRPP